MVGHVVEADGEVPLLFPGPRDVGPHRLGVALDHQHVLVAALRLEVGALVHGALVVDLAGLELDAVGAALLTPRHHHVLLHLQRGPCNKNMANSKIILYYSR